MPKNQSESRQLAPPLPQPTDFFRESDRLAEPASDHSRRIEVR